MSKVAIYARFSSDLQRDASIEDQIRECQARAAREGWTIVQCYTDHAISGASMNRPRIQALLRDAQEKKFDIVLAEALDRLSRDQGDTAHLHRQMKFLGIRIATLAEGDVGILDIGFKGVMNQLYLDDMKEKVRRGQRGRVEAGKITAGLAYGYSVVKKFGPDGKPVAGEREIIPSEAAIVRRIFQEYALGKSPRAIAVDLNRENIPSPRGGKWHPSTIANSQRRGLGIINCDLYRGKIIWNRTTELREPGTNRRIPRLNDESKLVTADAEHLRIVPDKLWQAVKEKQERTAKGARTFRDAKRPKYLLSGLLKCGECGGGFNKANHGRYACSSRRNAKSCENHLAIHQDDLEEAVIGGLRARLLTDELLQVFCEEYTRHINKLSMAKNARVNQLRTELNKLHKAKERYLTAIENGVPAEEVRDKIIAARDRREEIEKQLELTEETPVLLHPKMGDHYKSQIDRLVKSLNDESCNLEAQEILRSLIDKVVLTPNSARDELVIDLHGDLAGILAVAESRQDTSRRAAKTGTGRSPVLLVVGPEGLEPPTRPL
ncbi:recombinase family protein [Henriciella pelagia]|jgi:site-specific DNA recombinase|uniref:Resolvase n=1 Tax=Henriciella pelagia TaxID=1977912 RepID=A0ABQ1JFL3_9PROT|nr:resolvase [Henriciella pelagia]